MRTWTLGPDDYFLVGDAVELSNDSRAFGPFRRGALIGRAWMVHWPLERYRDLARGG